MSNKLIIPGILEKSLDKIKENIALVEGHVQLVQIDICDGKFVPNETYRDIKKIEAIDTPVDMELHLMVNDPQNYLPANNSIVRKIITHIESDGFDRLLLEELKLREFEIALALNPETDIYDLEPFLEEVNCVQFMSINPGFSGQKFLIETLEKIKIFHMHFPEIIIEIDGGINLSTIKPAFDVGVSLFEVNSFLFNDPENILENLEKLEKEIYAD